MNAESGSLAESARDRPNPWRRLWDRRSPSEAGRDGTAEPDARTVVGQLDGRPDEVID